MSAIHRIRADFAPSYALDCGAGIGRVTKQLLLQFCVKVDMLEPSPRLLEQSKTYLGEKANSIGRYICSGMEAFEPVEKDIYDLIWCQWVMVHLSDVDFVSFLRKCKEVGAQDETTPWINLHLESSSEWSTRDQRKRLDEWRRL